MLKSLTLILLILVHTGTTSAQSAVGADNAISLKFDESKILNGWVYSNGSQICESIDTVDCTNLGANWTKVQHGWWQEHFSKNWQITSVKNAYYIRFTNFECGKINGERLFYNRKKELVMLSKAYPIIADTVFNGVSIKHFKKGILEYESLEAKDIPTNEFVHLTFYYPSGKIREFTYANDAIGVYLTKRFNKNGECVYDLKNSMPDFLKRARF